MNAYLDDFVPQIHNVLKDETIQREIKLNALMAIGDICTYQTDKFNESFLSSTLMIMAQASRSALQKGNDPES